MVQSVLLNTGFSHLSLPLEDPVVVFALVLFIILLAPVILERFKIPGIIGLIVAGVIIGPNGFNILEKNSAVDLFSTVGLLYIMFLAGLELDLNEFKKHRHRSLLFGFLTFSIPLLVGLPICYYLLGFSWKASLLVASMFATHTLVAYPIASRLGISKNEAVAITVGGTILTDTAVLLILAIISGSEAGGLEQAFWIRLFISLLIFGFIVFFIFPRVARWFFINIQSERTSRYIFVMAAVFLAAFLAELAGIEPIIGAFMAGLALNPLIPHTSALMNRIEFVGNALFIPFFLISVGMLVDLNVLFDGPKALIVAGTLSAVALLSKWLASFFTQRIFRYSVPQRNVIFGLSSAHAAATLAVILIGYNIDLIDESVLNGTVILILITSLVASFVTENAGRKLAVTQQTTMDEVANLPEKILVSIANPSTIESLIDLAILLKNPKSPEPISALAIVKNTDEAQERILWTNKMLEQAVIHASATETKIQVVTRVDLNVSSGIANATKELLVNILIMGWAKKPTPVGRLFGTTMENILERTHETLLVCRIQQPYNVFTRILVVAPVNSEREVGFSLWVDKLQVLTKQLDTSLVFYCAPTTQAAIEQEVAKGKYTIPVSFQYFDNWQALPMLIQEVKKVDLFVIISARKGTLSYVPPLDDIPYKLSENLQHSNVIVWYPEQKFSEPLFRL